MVGRSSLSARSPTPENDHRPLPNQNDESLKHAPKAAATAQQARRQLCHSKGLEIKVPSAGSPSPTTAFIHTPQNYHREQAEGREKTAAILVPGNEGGVLGPSSIYLSIADKLASLNRGIPVLRLDHRFPARTKYCVADVLAAMNYLQNGYAVGRFVLVGWGFGGATVFTAAGQDSRIVGCATIASQSDEADGIEDMARRALPVLLIHGTEDSILTADCSRRLSERYRNASRGGEGEMAIFEGDDHQLSQKALKAEEVLCDFIMRLAGEEVGDEERTQWLQAQLRDVTN
ncbi:hypothetical protein KC318_g4272 [Hortaea werneckii]|uniref:AB hydrolase-1 domain-containing protein n=1 Tax=Hortaea werneckii TaxID=91943 RepID=A0A3M7A5Q4_HORWE|nr:hypothetical protein KC355_g3413 [Hortaea werneckii]KAI7670037.1 hypothetical protein KC318_g4272 [Hortaea werneckii]RMY22783.1 hypothetical protein D0867_02489 [Hortaea werneckii]RMY39329.1 hypothetical protein D0866_02007 [Hortaea werneckii]